MTGCSVLIAGIHFLKPERADLTKIDFNMSVHGGFPIHTLTADSQSSHQDLLSTCTICCCEQTGDVMRPKASAKNDRR